MKNVVSWDIKIQLVSQSRGIWNPVLSSQETHYISTTESGQFMLCKICGFHGGDYEEFRLLWYKNSVCTSQETHYVSATQPSQLMLCKIWCFHGSGYEECRLLRYNNPVRTSQEAHYISTTESSQLMLCKIWSFHDGDYCHVYRVCACGSVTNNNTWVRIGYRIYSLCLLLGCYAVWLL
jgi:hypothetical protein